MRVVGFSPWQQVPTSMRGAKFVYQMIGRSLSSTVSSSKRLKTDIASERKIRNLASALDYQPDLVLTSDHNISILGHTSSKKILRSKDNISTEEDVISEVPQWIYNSRPDEKSSFLSKQKSDAVDIGAVVDPVTRTVFVLQNERTVIKMWSLDEEVSGPDEEDDSMIQSFDLPSSVQSMDIIPFRSQTRVKIRDVGNKGNTGIMGGVAGTLTNGQLFLLLIDSLRRVHLDILGESDSKPNSSRRKSVSNSTKAQNFSKNHLFSIISLNVSNTVTNHESGQKRKLDSILAQDVDDVGEITISNLSMELKGKPAIVFTKHIISLKLDSNQPISSYIHQSSNVELHHKIYDATTNGNRSDNQENVQVSQLDPSHVAMVYKSENDGWFATIIDTKSGQSVVQQFPIWVNDSSTIVNIAGLSSSIIAVLTSDRLITVYDVRRAIIINQLKACDAFQAIDDPDNYHFRLISHWYSGTLGIVRNINEVKKKKNDSQEQSVEVSFGKIGIFDTENYEHDSSSKQALKGSYNLARAIASSMTSTSLSFPSDGIFHSNNVSEVKLSDWTPSLVKISKDSEIDAMKFMQKIELAGSSSGQKNGSKSLKLGSCVKEAINAYNSTGDEVPRKIIDVSMSVAFSRLHTSNVTQTALKESVEVFFDCMKTGKVSGRNHLESAGKSLRSTLLLVKKYHDSTRRSKKCIQITPLNIIYHLLRYCSGSITEHGLVTMVHFILCYISAEDFQQHWIEYANDDDWYSDTSIKVLQKRLKKAESQLQETSSKNEVKILIDKIEQRLYVEQQSFFIQAVVNNSRCNDALLKASLKEGLTHTDKGEVDILIYALSRLLKKVCSKRKISQNSEIKGGVTSNIAQWLSAVVDSNLTHLISSRTNKRTLASIESARKEVSAAIGQVNALLTLEDLLKYVDTAVSNSSHTKKAKEIAGPPPLYGIEMLIF